MVDVVSNCNKYILKNYLSSSTFVSIYHDIKRYGYCVCDGNIEDLFKTFLYWENVFSEKDDWYHEIYRLHNIFTLSPITFLFMFNFIQLSCIQFLNSAFR